MIILHICSPHLPDVATLPWEIQKSHKFNSIVDAKCPLACIAVGRMKLGSLTRVITLQLSLLPSAGQK